MPKRKKRGKACKLGKGCHNRFNKFRPNANVKVSGLNNIGNTCFFNAILQSLASITPLCSYLSSNIHSRGCKSVEFCLCCELERVVVELRSSKIHSFSPKQIITNLHKINNSFILGMQEDSHEYLRMIIDGIESCNLKQKLSCPIKSIFEGQFVSSIKCIECGYSSLKCDPFRDISLDVTSSKSVIGALARFTKQEQLNEENRWFCASCKNKVRAIKKITINSIPRILTIHLKRYAFFGARSCKVSKPIDYPEMLDLRDFTISKDTMKYKLFSVVVHSGHSSNGGHYYAFTKVKDQWFCLNDSSVYPTSIENVLKQQAYILFYHTNETFSTQKKNDLLLHATPRQQIKLETQPPSSFIPRTPQQPSSSFPRTPNEFTLLSPRTPPSKSKLLRSDLNLIRSDFCERSPFAKFDPVYSNKRKRPCTFSSSNTIVKRSTAIRYI